MISPLQNPGRRYALPRAIALRPVGAWKLLLLPQRGMMGMIAMVKQATHKGLRGPFLPRCEAGGCTC